jgi:hypothetical protein
MARWFSPMNNVLYMEHNPEKCKDHSTGVQHCQSVFLYLEWGSVYGTEGR